MKKSDFILVVLCFGLLLSFLVGCQNTENNPDTQDFVGTWTAASHHLIIRSDGTADLIPLNSGEENLVREGTFTIEDDRIVISKNLGLFFDAKSFSIDRSPSRKANNTVMVLEGIEFVKQSG